MATGTSKAMVTSVCAVTASDGSGSTCVTFGCVLTTRQTRARHAPGLLCVANSVSLPAASLRRRM